jgi:hypothetical protein
MGGSWWAVLPSLLLRAARRPSWPSQLAWALPFAFSFAENSCLTLRAMAGVHLVRLGCGTENLASIRLRSRRK